MKHVLDNPAWNGLISGNSNLAKGSRQVRYFDREVSPFAALSENSDENFRQLYEQLPDDSTILFVSPAGIDFSDQWKVLNYIQGLQMVHDGRDVPDSTAHSLVQLKDEHIPKMQELTKLTNPGPFAERTIDFGHYYGIFEGDKLVAMAGQRLNPSGYAEVSAVCTHPDYTGKGYAKQLLIHQSERIKAAAEIPFLHVRSNNERAIKVYESLGFATRIEVHFYVLKKNDGL